jgi:hypothetical protein
MGARSGHGPHRPAALPEGRLTAAPTAGLLVRRHARRRCRPGRGRRRRRGGPGGEAGLWRDPGIALGEADDHASDQADDRGQRGKLRPGLAAPSEDGAAGRRHQRVGWSGIHAPAGCHHVWPRNHGRSTCFAQQTTHPRDSRAAPRWQTVSDGRRRSPRPGAGQRRRARRPAARGSSGAKRITSAGIWPRTQIPLPLAAAGPASEGNSCGRASLRPTRR